MYESTRRIDEYAVESGFTVVVENVKRPFFDAGDFPERFAEIDALTCLDTGHAIVSGHDLEWQADLLAEYGNRIAHIHLNTRRSEAGEDGHLPVSIGSSRSIN